MKQKYYLNMAACVVCSKFYPVKQSNNSLLCLDCKMDSLNWKMKAEN